MDEEKEARWLIETVREGVKSEYWTILRNQILEWVEDEKRLRTYYNNVGIKDETERNKFNRAIDRLEYLKRFYDINEIIIKKHMTILERLKRSAKDLYDKTESFINARVR